VRELLVGHLPITSGYVLCLILCGLFTRRDQIQSFRHVRSSSLPHCLPYHTFHALNRQLSNFCKMSISWYRLPAILPTFRADLVTSRLTKRQPGCSLFTSLNDLYSSFMMKVIDSRDDVPTRRRHSEFESSGHHRWVSTVHDRYYIN
jgi:hypothetical protein